MQHYIAQKLAALQTDGTCVIANTMLLLPVLRACQAAGIPVTYGRRLNNYIWRVTLAS